MGDSPIALYQISGREAGTAWVAASSLGVCRVSGDILPAGSLRELFMREAARPTIDHDSAVEYATEVISSKLRSISLEGVVDDTVARDDDSILVVLTTEEWLFAVRWPLLEPEAYTVNIHKREVSENEQLDS